MEATKTKIFSAKYIESGGNATEAALSVSKTKNRKSARTLGSRLLANVDVKAELAKFAQKAVVRVEGLAEGARSEHVKLLANQDILDRAGFKPKDGEGGNKTLIINISGENAERYGLLPNQSPKGNS